MIDLSLEDQEVALISIDDSNSDIKKYYNNITYKIGKEQLHIQMLIKLNNSEKIIGYICSYDYNKIDGYAYINIFLDENERCINGALKKFVNYLFTCFPIRKLYYKGNLYNMNDMKFLKMIGFELEANLKNYTFLRGNYCDLYILAIYREKFYKE